MNDALKRYVDAATGLGNLTKARAEKVARQLVKQGEAASDQVGELVEELLDRQRKNREAVTEMVRAETKRVVRRMGLATSGEVERLETEISELRKEVADARSAAAETASKSSPAKKSTKKPAEKSGKKSTRKSTKKTAKRSSTPAKKAAKKTAKRTTTKKSGGGS